MVGVLANCWRQALEWRWDCEQTSRVDTRTTPLHTVGMSSRCVDMRYVGKLLWNLVGRQLDMGLKRSHGVGRQTTSIQQWNVSTCLDGWIGYRACCPVACLAVCRFIGAFLTDASLAWPGLRRCANTITLRGRVDRVASPPQASPPQPLRHDKHTTAAVHSRANSPQPQPQAPPISPPPSPPQAWPPFGMVVST